MSEQPEKFASDAQSVHAAHGAILFEQAECCALENVKIDHIGYPALSQNITFLSLLLGVGKVKWFQ